MNPIFSKACKNLVSCFLSVVCMAVVCFSQAPVNDECAGAITLNVNADNSCANVYTGTTGYATQSSASCIASGYGAKDVWFKFTAIAASQRITVSPVGSDNYVFEVLEGNCGSLVSVACVNTGGYQEPDVVLLTALVPGNIYYIRLYQYYGEAGPSLQFRICISTTTSILNNDECTGAETVIPYTNNYTDVMINNTGATQSMPGCLGTAEDDAWFKFTAIASRHRVTVSTATLISPVLEIFEGSCGALQSKVCRYNNNGNPYSFIDADLTSLNPGTTYYYRVYGAGSNNPRTNVRTAVSTPPPAPANDECSGAINLDINTGSTCTIINNGNLGYATQSLASCINTGYDARDVWYKFTAAAASQRITVTPQASNNFVFEVFEGNCNSLVSKACVNTGSPSEPDVVLLHDFVPGNTYYIRVYNYYSETAPYMQFNICISSTSAILSNDECSGAATVVPYTTTYSGVTINNTGATQSMAGCFGNAEDDIWFTFTATASRHRVIVTTANNIDPVLEIFSGSCGSLVSMACRYINGGSEHSFIDADLTNLSPGTTYYYRVYGAAVNSVRTNITTAVSTPPAAPSNDDCSTAISLEVNAGNACNNQYTGSPGYATQSLPSCTPTGYDARDVWFKFIAVDASQRITLNPLQFNNYIFQVFEGDCNSLVSKACVNTGASNEPDVLLLNDCIPGNTYYIRVYNYYGETSSAMQFSICINSTSKIVENDDCSDATVVIPSNTDGNAGTIIKMNNTGATQSMAGCFGTAEDDIWFRFTATSSRHIIKVSTEQDINPVLQVFSGACGLLNSKVCSYNNSGGSYSYIDADLPGLIPGTTYYYRVYGAGVSNARTNITTSVFTPPVYLFIGNGNWDEPSNWKDGAIPPAITSSSVNIFINPPAGNKCVVNIPVTIANGASLVVAPGVIMQVNGNLTIGQQ